MTLGDIKNRVWDRLGEDSADPQRYPATLVTSIAQEATRVWSALVGNTNATQTVTLLDDTISYTLEEDFVSLISVVNDQTNEHLYPISWQELYRSEGLGRNRAWRDVRSDRPTHYCRFSHDTIWLWPAMSTASGTISVNYRPEITTDLTLGDSEVPILPVEFHDNLVDYVVGRCLLYNARGDRLAEGMELIGRWGQAIATAKESRLQAENTFAGQGAVLNNGKVRVI